MTESSEKAAVPRIDIRKIFHEKNPGIAGMLPGFVYRYLERILHQDFINGFLERHGHKGGLEFIEAACEEFEVNIEIRGEENLPEKGHYLFVSNHPLGGFDGIMLIRLLRRHYPKVIVLVNDILMNINNLEEFFIPVNKHGGQARENVRLIEETYRSNAQILTFPAGIVSRKIHGLIQDPVWQKSFVIKAVQSRRDVIPIHVSGRNTGRFYRIANIRKFLHVKWNLEMFLLPDETYRHRDKTFTFTIGRPIPCSTFDKTFRPMEWAAKVRDLVYRLPLEENPSLTGAE